MKVLISFLGSTLDNHGRGQGRWGVWRPSVALAMQENIHFDRYFILYQPVCKNLLDAVVSDIRTCSPDTEVIPEELPFRDPWDFEEVYSRLYDFSRKKNFASEDHDYFIHITTGTHVAQICLFLLNESHHLPGKLIQTQPTGRNSARGSFTVIDLDLSRYDLLAKRFAVERRNDLDFLREPSVCLFLNFCHSGRKILTRLIPFIVMIDTISHVEIYRISQNS